MFETFLCHLESSVPIFIPTDLDCICEVLHYDPKRERGLVEVDDFVHRAAHPGPFDLAADAVFPTEDLSQRIAAADTVQDAKSVADVALAAGVGADDDGEWADAQRFVSEVFEIDKSN